MRTLYLTLFVTIFLFVLYCSEKFKVLEKKIISLTRSLALEQAKQSKLKKHD